MAPQLADRSLPRKVSCCGTDVYYHVMIILSIEFTRGLLVYRIYNRERKHYYYASYQTFRQGLSGQPQNHL